MANLKEVRNRIESVKSTQQITKAMKMVSASKLRRAQNAIIQVRPFTQKLKGVIDKIQNALEGGVELQLAEKRDVKKVAIVVVTSDKGLCGGFNANLIKTAKLLIQTKYPTQMAAGNVEVVAVGKKAMEAFRKLPVNLNYQYGHLISKPEFKNSGSLVDDLILRFHKGEIDAVEVVYAEFKNALTQFFHGTQLLPIAPIAADESLPKVNTDYIFEPDTAYIIESLIPSFLKIQLHKFILDTSASEHGARMTSMDKATENAGELLKALKLDYNRARQAAITTELTEIVAGAAALNG